MQAPYTGFVSADLEKYIRRSDALDLNTYAWHEVASHPVSTDAVRALRYMHDIESHTLVYMREMLASPAVDDPEIGPFLACWLYEETFHGLAFDRFLAAAGHAVPRRMHGKQGLRQRLSAAAAAMIARSWSNFTGVQMLWGAINELTTMLGYQRLARLDPHPVLAQILERTAKDEARHFSFYFHQARKRLSRPRDAARARWFIEKFWAPVGSGVQPSEETRFITGYLFSGPEGQAAAEKIDARIRLLPGFEDARPFMRWFERYAHPWPAAAKQPAPMLET